MLRASPSQNLIGFQLKCNCNLKIKIVKALWKIVYSNKNADIYEANLMRRLTGLLYIDSKTMANIKDKIKNENSR